MFEEMTSEGDRREMKDVETDGEREGGMKKTQREREGWGGVEGSSVSFPGMQPRDCLLQRGKVGKQRDCS